MLLAVLGLGCGVGVTQPAASLRFDLSAIDGHPLPRTPIGWPADATVEAASLEFDVGTALADGTEGLVTYTIRIAGEDRPEPLRYQVVGGVLAINLCPLRAACPVVVTELLGPVPADGGPLLLTYAIAGVASSVFRFDPLGLD